MNAKLSYSAMLISISLLAGCASTGGSHQSIGQPMNMTKVAKYSELVVNVQPTNNAKLSQTDTDRMTKLIADDIKAQNPTRFATVNPLTPPSRNTLQALVRIKNYDEGSSFARSLLAGLGQIHIDADVILNDATTQEKIAQYEVNKTFAWGGLYGAMTTIKDAEVGFCESVANSILGKDE